MNDQGRAKMEDDKIIPELFTPESNPFGVPYSEWTVRWWQWCLSQPKSTNPVNDRKRTDRNASNNQNHAQVWFLSGTTGGVAERECIVPRGKAILCPIINFAITTAEDPNLKTDNELQSYAKNDVDKILNVNMTIDGRILSKSEKFRVESGPFDVMLPEDNICGVKAGPTRAAADGYWFFLKPLHQGNHDIRFAGSCLAGTINIGAIFHIMVQ